MPLLVGQIFYTNFPGKGLKLLASEQVPLEIQQAFIQQVAAQSWDAYNSRRNQAAYLYQFSSNRCLFGWLYTEKSKDGSNIPYFICYYLELLLDTIQLETILRCLDTGPIDPIEPNNLPSTLKPVVVPDLGRYQSMHQGVKLSSEIRSSSHKTLRQGQLLNWFALEKVPHKATERQLLAHNGSDGAFNALPPVFASRRVTEQSLSSMSLEVILQELVAKTIGIQGVVLVSSKGRPIIPAIGMDENTASTLAGMMLYLAKRTQEELKWPKMETIAVREKNGRLILSSCQLDVFLLVKAGKALTGLLEGEINRTVKQLQIALQVEKQEPCHLTL